MDDKDYIEMCEKSIEHWENDWKKLALFGGDVKYAGLVFCAENCHCCQEFTFGIAADDGDCWGCPMLDEDNVNCMGETISEGVQPVRMTDMPSSLYIDAMRAHDDSKDKEAFHVARKAIIKRLRDAMEARKESSNE